MKRDDVGGTTPFPNTLVDLVMPQLTDTSWRVLVVVVRQTIGWRDCEGRKRSDWISHSQLRRRTGRASAALSRAVANLVDLKVIETRDAKGRLLTSTEARRHLQGRLYFSLGPLLPALSKTEFQEAKTTKETLTKTYRPRPKRGWQKAG